MLTSTATVVVAPAALVASKVKESAVADVSVFVYVTTPPAMTSAVPWAGVWPISMVSTLGVKPSPVPEPQSLTKRAPDQRCRGRASAICAITQSRLMGDEKRKRLSVATEMSRSSRARVSGQDYT